MSFYTVNILHGGRLARVVRDVQAPDYDTATRRGVQAASSRSGDTPAWLLDLWYHVTVPGQPAPLGVEVWVDDQGQGARIV